MRWMRSMTPCWLRRLVNLELEVEASCRRPSPTRNRTWTSGKLLLFPVFRIQIRIRQHFYQSRSGRQISGSPDLDPSGKVSTKLSKNTILLSKLKFKCQFLCEELVLRVFRLAGFNENWQIPEIQVFIKEHGFCFKNYTFKIRCMNRCLNVKNIIFVKTSRNHLIIWVILNGPN